MSEHLRVLFEMQKAVREMADASEQVAQIAKANNETGIAFAAHMLRHSLLAYSKAVAAYMKKTGG